MLRKTTLLRIILILLNIGVIICYLITCLCPFINTAEDWFLAFPGLIFPLIFFALLFFIIIWLILKSRWWIVSAIILLMGFQQIITVFAFHIPKDFSHVKTANTLRVLQWNVSSWDESGKDNNGQSYQPLMFDLIKAQDADVLCFEEYFDPITPHNYEPNVATFVNMGYAFHYFVATDVEKNDYETGIAIFSKYPIIDSANYSFRKTGNSEHLLYTDIKVNDKIFRVFATHLQSVHFVGEDYESLRVRHPHETLRDSRTIVSKLKRGYVSRYKQAQLVSEKIRESPYQAFICGDFNDVPNSSTYFKIKGDFQDAFLKKGVFLGRTFRFISPTLRIDYILSDKRFKVVQYQRLKVPYSDHYAVEADLSY
jgi:endonuclease/exonuclease/phosphatase family metal-dependent hydrolase